MIERDAGQRLIELWADFPVVLVSGARQVGKTTLITRLAHKLAIAQQVSLDHSGAQERAAEDPELFVEGLRIPAFIDEAQKSPTLFGAIKQQVDHHRRPGQFVLSGSANFLLLRRVSESLAGRAARLFLRGISLRERLGRVGQPPHVTDCLKARSAKDLLARCHATSHAGRWPAAEWSHDLLNGRFPELVARSRREAFRLTWLEGYVDAFVEKDLPDLGDVHSRMEFRRFWRIAASSAAQLRELSALGSALGVSYHTAARYLGLLEQGCHVFHLEPYFANIGKRLTKAPKLFVEDTGLALFLSGTRQQEQFDASDRRGAWLENFAVAELKSTIELLCPGVQMWFWRTLAGAEVDLVLEDGRRLLPIEVKWSSKATRRDGRALEMFTSDLRSRVPFGMIACGTTEPFLLSDRIVVVPLGWLLT